MTPLICDLILLERHLTVSQMLYENLGWDARARQVERLAQRARRMREREQAAYRKDCEGARGLEGGAQ
jgi:hypothetical protein